MTIADNRSLHTRQWLTFSGSCTWHKLWYVTCCWFSIDLLHTLLSLFSPIRNRCTVNNEASIASASIHKQKQPCERNPHFLLSFPHVKYHFSIKQWGVSGGGGTWVENCFDECHIYNQTSTTVHKKRLFITFASSSTIFINIRSLIKHIKGVTNECSVE